MSIAIYGDFSQSSKQAILERRDFRLKGGDKLEPKKIPMHRSDRENKRKSDFLDFVNEYLCDIEDSNSHILLNSE